MKYRHEQKVVGFLVSSLKSSTIAHGKILSYIDGLWSDT